MELTKEKAKEILEKLGGKFMPGQGTMIVQAEKLMAEKMLVLNDAGEVINEAGEVVVPVSAPNDGEENGEGEDKGKKVKIVMIENVLHDGESYDKGNEYSVSEKIAKIFKEQKFI